MGRSSRTLIITKKKQKTKKPIADTLEILGRYHLDVCLPACGWCALIIISHAQYMCCGRELIAGKSLASILKQTCKRTRRLRRHRLTLKGLPPRLAVPRGITARLTFPWHKKYIYIKITKNPKLERCPRMHRINSLRTTTWSAYNQLAPAFPRSRSSRTSRVTFRLLVLM